MNIISGHGYTIASHLRFTSSKFLLISSYAFSKQFISYYRSFRLAYRWAMYQIKVWRIIFTTLYALPLMIFTLIEDSKSKGIWIRELRDGSGLSQIQLRKVLKSLEQKKLIKNVKAVGTSKKCYMLYDLEPDSSLTGGTFYSDQQLDSELIYTLVNVCTGYVNGRRKQAIDAHPDDFQMQKELSAVRPQEIADFILEKRVLNVTITLEDIERILDVAVLDGAIERRPDGKNFVSIHLVVLMSIISYPASALWPYMPTCVIR
ncbi:RNA polymerase Rpc34 subunit [Dictyocaulus viviparus]|uniref:RNA polymerase Rpc34 subunit n=1 Tax=Dictyocaulus viviparus TaxID=29172 RepID=A0A0D8Y903_DICVI|nr:RNA polymerase Rpc34 subunit [Dictyocaulus viviparus]